MADIKIQIEGGEELRRLMSDPQLIQGPLREFLTRSAFITEGLAKTMAPVDTGRLRASVITIMEPSRALVGPTVHYAPHVEYGSRPHWAPKGALQPWARRHGFPMGPVGDFLVRRIIARRGTKAHPFMRPAAAASLPLIRVEFHAMIQAIQASWSGHAI